MDQRRALYLRLFAGLGALLVWVTTVAYVVERDDILRADLDPRIPFQVYKPPPAPDYSQASAWALLGEGPAGAAPADIFFIHSTTYDGGANWLGPIHDRTAERRLQQEVLPNHAGPFASLGHVYAPRYRQASLYAYRLTQREDAREARQFAYGDVAQAFHYFLTRYSQHGPIIIAGVGQGAQLADRLTREAAADPVLRARIAAVYLMEEAIPAAAYPPSGPLALCAQRAQAHCVVAWRSLSSGGPQRERILTRTLVWTAAGDLSDLGDQALACVNPLSGKRDDGDTDSDQNLGAANATGRRWNLAPPLRAKQVEAQCVDGLLSVTTPERPDLRATGDWAARLRSPAYNLFYADIEADARARLSAWYGGPLAEPINRTSAVQPSIVHSAPAGR